jgi:phospholipase C
MTGRDEPSSRMRFHRLLPLALVAVLVALTALSASAQEASPPTAVPPDPSAFDGPVTEPMAPITPGPAPWADPNITKLEHLIFIVQENRSFDHYFGLYENPFGRKVNGIPRKPSGAFAVCNPHPVLNGRCLKPFRTSNPVNKGGPHSHTASVISENGGAMNGFIQAAVSGRGAGSYFCANNPFAARCSKFNGPQGQPDAMSTMTRAAVPNYWSYADWGVLQDRMFAPVDSWSLPAHLYLYSAWSAECPGGPLTCQSAIETDSPGPYKWTPITYLLDEAGVSWKNYVGDKTDVSCVNWPCQDIGADVDATPWIWNVLPNFTTVVGSNQRDRTQPVSQFFDDAAAGKLPKVSWILPSLRNSEHPAHGSMQPGQTYVTRLINAVGNGPDWGSTAVFITWDDWGGFYDHVQPPNIDRNGYGLRVPGLMISPYAKEGFVDHQTLSFDAYLKLIEDRFLGGGRLPGDRADNRPKIRENADRLGDLTAEFDFLQVPRVAPILDPTPAVPATPEGVSEALRPNAPW